MTDFVMYTIPGKPPALQRARISFRHQTPYNPQKELQLIQRITLAEQHLLRPMFKGPIAVRIIYYMPISNSSVNKKKGIAEGVYHSATPDLDNLIKMTCDVMQGVLYANDCLISKIKARKVYSKDPRTEIFIREIHEKTSK